MASPVVTCQACRFWATTNGHNGRCKRNAPQPTESADEIACWPETFLTDLCGQGEGREGPAAGMVSVEVAHCTDCAFWSAAKDGIYPVDRLGGRVQWGREAGYCKRYSPSPASSSGHRGFWRVTHHSDNCAEGVPAS